MSDATISAAPLVAYITPIISAVVVAIIGWAASAAVAELRKLTGLNIQQAAVADVTARAEAAGRAMVAAASDNLANASIKVNDPIVSKIAGEIMAEAPKVLSDSGLTPNAVSTAIVGEIGRLQANMTPPPATPVLKLDVAPPKAG